MVSVGSRFRKKERKEIAQSKNVRRSKERKKSINQSINLCATISLRSTMQRETANVELKQIAQEAYEEQLGEELRARRQLGALSIEVSRRDVVSRHNEK